MYTLKQISPIMTFFCLSIRNYLWHQICYHTEFVGWYFQAWSCFLISTNLDVYLFIRFMATWSKRRMLSSLDWGPRYLKPWAMIVFLDKTCCKLPPKSSAIIRTSPKLLTVFREWTPGCDFLKITKRNCVRALHWFCMAHILINLRNP